mmetsp:Transcript_19203/g.41528  ORF Transcript_19203/g.41528 Transcript_19203/m.41528 type:complete len:107 (+) Transcript_19203:4176-4496(+)
MPLLVFSELNQLLPELEDRSSDSQIVLVLGEAVLNLIDSGQRNDWEVDDFVLFATANCCQHVALAHWESVDTDVCDLLPTPQTVGLHYAAIFLKITLNEQQQPLPR